MLKAFRDPTYQNFSAFFVGWSATIIIYVGFAITAMNGHLVPWWQWWFGFPILMLGLFIDMLSKRLRWIRCYQVAIYCLTTFVLTQSVVITINRASEAHLLSTALALGSINLMTALSAFYQTLTNPLRKTIPHGAIGRVERQTGHIFPTQSPPKIQADWEKTKVGLELIYKSTPLFSGVALFIVQLVAAPTTLIWIGLLFSPLMVICAYGMGSYLAYVVWIVRWEKVNRKIMIVKT